MKHLSFDVDDETYAALLEEYTSVKKDFKKTNHTYPFTQYLHEVIIDALKTDEENEDDRQRILKAFEVAGDRGATPEQALDMANDDEIVRK